MGLKILIMFFFIMQLFFYYFKRWQVFPLVRKVLGIITHISIQFVLREWRFVNNFSKEARQNFIIFLEIAVRRMWPTLQQKKLIQQNSQRNSVVA